MEWVILSVASKVWLYQHLTVRVTFVPLHHLAFEITTNIFLLSFFQAAVIVTDTIRLLFPRLLLVATVTLTPCQSEPKGRR